MIPFDRTAPRTIAALDVCLEHDGWLEFLHARLINEGPPISVFCVGVRAALPNTVKASLVGLVTRYALATLTDDQAGFEAALSGLLRLLQVPGVGMAELLVGSSPGHEWPEISSGINAWWRALIANDHRARGGAEA